jgi:predicted enzyme related to lactoylglutathione lyase
MSTDPPAAERFYSQLIGSTTKKGDIADQPYTEWVNGEISIGGLMQLPDEAQQQGAPSHWLAYVAVPSVDDTLQQAEELGGTKVLAQWTSLPWAGLPSSKTRRGR